MRRFALGILATLLALPVSPAAAQAPERGSLLVASAEVESFRFARTVIFIVHHADNGTLGLIVNRPTRLEAAEAFEALDGLGDYEGRVFIGGPVAPTRPLLLMNDPAGALSESDPVFDSIHIAADTELVRRHAGRLGDESTLRVYAGHVQWEPGQLESEIGGGSWHVLEGRTEAVFSDDPLTLYERLAAEAPALVTAGM